MKATGAWRWVLALLGGLFLIPLGVGTALAVASPSVQAYGASDVYDGALHSVHAHTGEAAPL